MKKFLLFTALLYWGFAQAQIVNDNNSFSATISAGTPISITVPPGENKALIIIPESGDSDDFTFNPFNGLNAVELGRLTWGTSGGISIWMVPLGDVTTTYSADLSNVEESGTFTVFTINNVDQDSNTVLVQSEKHNSFEVWQHYYFGKSTKKAGDMTINAFLLEGFGGFCNSAVPFVVSNSVGNTVQLEHELLVGVGAAPYISHYTSIVSDPNELISWALTDCFDPILFNLASHQLSITLNAVSATLRNETVEEVSFQVYPNPTNDLLRLSVPVTGTYVIYNSLGQEVKRSPEDASMKAINIAELAQGMYILQLTTDANEVMERRFLIE